MLGWWYEHDLGEIQRKKQTSSQKRWRPLSNDGNNEQHVSIAFQAPGRALSTLDIRSPLNLLLGGFPGGASGKEPACQCRRCKRHGCDPWVGKIAWGTAWQSTPVFLPGESHGQRSLVGYSPWGRKELDTADWLSMHARCLWIVIYVLKIQKHIWKSHTTWENRRRE